MADVRGVAIVTGSSSGIGFETSLTLARNGFYTYATMRNTRKSASIKRMANKEVLPLEVIQLDVNDDLSVKNAIEEIISEKERIDILVNNAGYGLIGSIEDISLKELKAQFETNLFGVIRVTKQVLPIMRRQKEGGRIINVSHKNAKIVIKSDKAANFSPYTQTMNKMFEAYKEVIEEYKISAEEVAKVILNAAISANPVQRYLVGKYSETMMEAKRTMSDAQSHNMMDSQLLSSK
jgi:short-subunit dehydrogenase involved in D-alanine esterification of teichoic acids